MRLSDVASHSGIALLAVVGLLFTPAVKPSAGSQPARLVVVLYPDDNDGRPGNVDFDRGLRSTLLSGPIKPVDVHNEYLDVARFSDAAYQEHLADFLRKKYAGRKVDLVITGLASGLDFALKQRDRAFPGVPIIYAAVDRREIEARQLPRDVVGVPITMDLTGTLNIALKQNPGTRRVYVVSGNSLFDKQWEAEARTAFAATQNGVEFVYLAGLPLDQLLETAAELPPHSVIYYLHVFQDGRGNPFVPAEVAEQLAARANVPVYGHVDTYVGRGIVGGRVFSLAAEGKNAADVALRILSGERPEDLDVKKSSANVDTFDKRQMDRWGIGRDTLPAGSVVRFEEPNFWFQYRWHIVGVLVLCVIQFLLIFGLIVDISQRHRAEVRLRGSQQELRSLTGRLLQAQEEERRRLARELHDDLNQNLALLAVEMDLLLQRPPETPAAVKARLGQLSAQVRQISSAVHDLSHQLHPAKLEQLGLVAAVRGLCQELMETHSTEISFRDYALPDSVSDPVSLCVYRIAQEALQNAIKHSRCTRVNVTLHGMGDHVKLRVQDDGVGFELNQVDGKGSLGLVSMHERLRMVGGEISIDTRPAGGTCIEVSVPLTPSESAYELQSSPAGIS